MNPSGQFAQLGLALAWAVVACHPLSDQNRRRGGVSADGGESGAPSEELPSIEDSTAGASTGGTGVASSPSRDEHGGSSGGGGEGDEHGGSSGGGGEGDEPADAQRPTILFTQPASGDVGVMSGPIVIQFSEPMNRASVEAMAFSERAALNSFFWNEANDSVSIDVDLLFGEGESIETAPRHTVHLEVEQPATDLAGNELAEPLQLSFQLAVRVAKRLEVYPALRGHAEGTYILAGDTSLDTLHMGLLTFPLSEMPATLRLEAAHMMLRLRNRVSGQLVQGSPVMDLGNLLVEHATFSERSSVAYAPDAKLGDVGILIPAQSLIHEGQLWEIDVTTQVSADLQRPLNSGNSQYRLRFATGSDDDGEPDQLMFWNLFTTSNQCEVACDPSQVPALEVRFLTP